MAATYEPIATYTFPSNGTSGATYTFSSISSNYTDLILIGLHRDTFVGANGNHLVRVGNGSIDTGSNYSQTILNTDGSFRYTNLSYFFIANPAQATSTFSTSITHFENYSNTTTNKTFLTRTGGGFDNRVEASVSLWRSTSAINTIQILPQTNFAQGTTFTLYGIKAA